MKTRLKSIIKYLIAGAGLSFVIFYYRGILNAENMAQRLMVLSDGFFFAGVILSGIGGLIAMSNDGMFDMISFGMKSLFSVFNFKKKGHLMEETFADYRLSRQNKKKPFLDILIAGIVYIVFAGICTIAFEKAVG